MRSPVQRLNSVNRSIRGSAPLDDAAAYGQAPGGLAAGALAVPGRAVRRRRVRGLLPAAAEQDGGGGHGAPDPAAGAAAQGHGRHHGVQPLGHGGRPRRVRQYDAVEVRVAVERTLELGQVRDVAFWWCGWGGSADGQAAVGRVLRRQDAAGEARSRRRPPGAIAWVLLHAVYVSYVFCVCCVGGLQMIQAIFDKVQEGAWVHIFPEGKIVQHEGESSTLCSLAIVGIHPCCESFVCVCSARWSAESASRGDRPPEVGRGQAHRTRDDPADRRARLPLQHGAAHAAGREEPPDQRRAQDEPRPGRDRRRAAVVRRPLRAVRGRPRGRRLALGDAGA
ncbi:hypothetical protein ON010_g17749 [Phytophthora cinnamomi]|nr:hypothetical protein ON010_g17749 [Phytophthora cinnamomi]